MDEDQELNVSNNTSLGKVQISSDVIEVITGIAASEIEGLSAMRGSFARDVVERFGIKSHSKGVKVEVSNSGILIDLYVVLMFGVSIPEVAQKLQTNIKQTVKNMTALEVNEINIHVVGIEMDDDSEESQDE